MAILTRQTSGTGVTNNNAPLTNTEVDTNFIELVAGIAGKQPLDADLTAIAGLTGTEGFLKKTAANTWELDTAPSLAYVKISGDTMTGDLAIDKTNAKVSLSTSSIQYNSTENSIDFIID